MPEKHLFEYAVMLVVPQVERELRDVIREFEYTIIMLDGSASRVSCSDLQRGKESVI